MYHYEYLDDAQFLQQVTESYLKEQYFKITVLDWNENPIRQITGQTIGGSINIDGSSAMRRTASIELIADKTNDLTNLDNFISLNKKVNIEIGLKNIFNKYIQYPILWFPQGVFLIVDASISYNTEGVKINLTLHDKMALLNGECGGVLPAPITFSEMEDEDEYGNKIITKPRISSIIKELVHHYGNEQEKNIIIKDIDKYAKQVLKWNGPDNKSLYYFYINSQDIGKTKLNENNYKILKSFITNIQPSIEEDEFYSKLLQKLIDYSLKNNKQYQNKPDAFPNAESIVQWIGEEPSANSKLQELKEGLKSLKEVLKNSQSLSETLEKERNFYNDVLSSAQSQLFISPQQFKQPIDELSTIMKDFFQNKWYNVVHSQRPIKYTINDKEKTYTIKTDKLNKLQAIYQNKNSIEDLINKLKTLRDKITTAKNRINSKMSSWGYYKNTEAVKKNKLTTFNKEITVSSKDVLAWLMTFFEEEKKYITPFSGSISQKYRKEHSKYFYKWLSKDIFIRGESKHIRYGCCQTGKGWFQREVTPSGNSGFLAQKIFANKIQNLKAEYNNQTDSQEFLAKYNEIRNYKCFEQLNNCFSYFITDEKEKYCAKLINEMYQLFKKSSLGDSQIKTFCDTFVSFVEAMLQDVNNIKEDYTQNITTFNVIRTKALTEKVYNELDIFTYAEEIINKLESFTDKLPRDYIELTIPIVKWAHPPTTTNFRDIGKYIVNNSAIFSDKNETTRKQLAAAQQKSLSQLLKTTKSKLNNFDFSEYNLNTVMQQIRKIIVDGEYAIPATIKQHYTNNINKNKVLDLAIKNQPDEKKKERKELKNQIKLSQEKIVSIQEQEMAIFTGCNQALQKWYQNNLKSYIDLQTKLNNNNSNKTYAQQIKKQNTALNKINSTIQQDQTIISKMTSIAKNMNKFFNANVISDKNTVQNVANTYFSSNVEEQTQKQKQLFLSIEKLSKNIEQAVNDWGKIATQLTIQQKEIERNQRKILQKNSLTTTVKNSLNELEQIVNERESDLNKFYETLKQKRISILKDFFNVSSKAYKEFFSSMAVAALQKDRKKSPSQQRWKSITANLYDFKKNEEYEDSRRIIINNLFEDISIKNYINRNNYWHNQFYGYLAIPAKLYGIKEYKYGEDIGYTLSDFIYPGELTSQPGETIFSVLDKIKNTLGNYEYFYDINGHFVFQEIKNYLNKSYSTYLSKENLINQDFNFDYYSNTPVVYDFSNSKIIQSYQNSPQYQQIKNDFVIWGERESIDGQKIPIRYHLAIDSELFSNLYYFFDIDKLNNQQIFLHKSELPTIPSDKTKKFYIKEENCFYEWVQKKNEFIGYKKIDYINNPNCKHYLNESKFPKTGSEKNLYYSQQSDLLYKWNIKKKQYEITYSYRIKYCYKQQPNIENATLGRYYYIPTQQNQKRLYLCKLSNGAKGEKQFETIIAAAPIQNIKNSNTSLYLEGLFGQVNGLLTNDYYVELKNEWPKIWDLYENKMFDTVNNSITSLDYYLHLINLTTLNNKFSVSQIGRRSQIISNSKINCIFEPSCPNIMFFDNNSPTTINSNYISNQTKIRDNYQLKTKEEKNKDLIQYNQNNISNFIPFHINHSIFKYFVLGGNLRSAYEEIRSELYKYINYGNQVSINILPMYYLQPNILIKIFDPVTGINGNFLIKNYSISLNTNNNMSLTCTKIVSRV